MKPPRNSFAVGVGRRLRIARDAAGLNQAQLARLLDVDEMRLSNWELGKHHLPGEFALFIYQRTRIDPNWLYLGDPNRLPADIHARVIAAIVDEPELSSPKGNPRPSRRLRSIKPDDPE